MSPLLGSPQFPRHQEFGVSTRQARVPAPRKGSPQFLRLQEFGDTYTVICGANAGFYSEARRGTERLISPPPANGGKTFHDSNRDLPLRSGLLNRGGTLLGDRGGRLRHSMDLSDRLNNRRIWRSSSIERTCACLGITPSFSSSSTNKKPARYLNPCPSSPYGGKRFSGALPIRCGSEQTPDLDQW
jgi:hypothetical protein